MVVRIHGNSMDSKERDSKEGSQLRGFEGDGYEGHGFEGGGFEECGFEAWVRTIQNAQILELETIIYSKPLTQMK